MKKLITILMICALIFTLCACNVKTTTYLDGSKKVFAEEFTLIKKVTGKGLDNDCYYIYDNSTKIVYLYTRGGYHATMCPYYIIENGAPTLAIYGINYNC